MPIRYEVKAYPKAVLDSQAKPEVFNQPEFIPWVWYDTQNIATNQGQLSFFASTNNDTTITNIQIANTFSADQYFRPFCITLDWLIGATYQGSSGAANIVDDLLAIQNAWRGIFYLRISAKDYAQVPMHALHASGGIYVSALLGTVSSGILNYGMNWMPDGGYWINGAIVFAPLMNFQCFLQGTGSLTLNASPRSTRISFHGSLSRRVL